MSTNMSHQKCIILYIQSGEPAASKNAVLDRLREITTLTGCSMCCFTSTWIDASQLSEIMYNLKEKAASGGRMILLIAGDYLEDQVSICALKALEEGFDVHLLCDIVQARVNKH